MPKIQYRGLIRQGLGNPAKSRKAAHALDFVQGIFHLPVRQVEPILHAVDTKRDLCMANLSDFYINSYNIVIILWIVRYESKFCKLLGYMKNT